MIENYKSSNGFPASNLEEMTIAPTFDISARRTARMVVPLTPTAIEATLSELTQIKAASQYNNNITPDIRNHSLISQQKTNSYLKFFFITALTVFVLGTGAVGGFALAQYQNWKEKQGIALIPQPALNKTKGLPKLTLEVFEDPDEFAEVTEETIGDNPNMDDESKTEPKPSPIPKKRPRQEKADIQTEPSDNEQQSSPPQEQRERKVRKPKPEDNSNINRNGQKQTQPQHVKESVFQKLKRAIEKIGQN